MRREKKSWFWHFDWLIFFSMLALSVIGVIAIANASQTSPEGWTGLREFFSYLNTYYSRLHALWILIGMVAMAGGMLFDTKVYNTMAVAVYWSVIVLLGITLFMPAISGTSAWIQITENRTVQPAEFAKISLIIMLAHQLSRLEHGVQRLPELILPMFLALIPIGIVFAQNEGGSAIVMVFIVAVMLFASGTNWRILLGLTLFALAAAGVALYLLNEQGSFRIERITSFLDPSSNLSGSNWTTLHSKLAIGSGGLWGKGLFAPGTLTSLSFIPQNHTDFIFSSWAEATGFVGGMAVVLLFLLLMGREIRLSMIVKNRFGSLVIIGVVAMQFIHVFENIGMCIGVMPVMGIPLPFVSYGGTSMLTNMLAVGLVLGIGMRKKQLLAPQ